MAEKTTPARPALPILTSLRFFAAAEVVFRHHQAPLPTEFLRGITSAGYQAVTFFFILSGFILTYVYTGSTEESRLTVTARNFWRARFARIGPAYFLALVLLLPRFCYTALVSKIMPLNKLFLGLVLVPIFQQAWWPPAALLWNTPAWSLSVEVFFYATFPGLGRLTARIPRAALLVLTYGAVVGVVFFRSVVLPTFGETEGWHNFRWFFPLFHLPQFLFGAALGRMYLFGPRVSQRIHVWMFSIGTVGFGLVFGYLAFFPWWTRTDALLVLLFGLVIYGAARADSSLSLLALPAFIFLGEASYSIYILHTPVDFWWSLAVTKLWGKGLHGLGEFWLYFAVVIAISSLSLLFFEIPMRRRVLAFRAVRGTVTWSR